MENFQLIHNSSGTVIAEGSFKDGVKTFEGNYYIKKKYFIDGMMKTNYVPGICFYKFIYVWMDLILPGGKKIKNAGWMYIVPNPIFYFIIGRIGIPQSNAELSLKKYSGL